MLQLYFWPLYTGLGNDVAGLTATSNCSRGMCID